MNMSLGHDDGCGAPLRCHIDPNPQIVSYALQENFVHREGGCHLPESIYHDYPFVHTTN